VKSELAVGPRRVENATSPCYGMAGNDVPKRLAVDATVWTGRLCDPEDK
jgi:hypothetical protein